MTRGSGALIKLGDIADVRDGFHQPENYARYNGKNVVTLNVIKKSGQNLLDASDKIKAIIADMQKTKLPSNLVIEVTGDQSRNTRNTVNELKQYYYSWIHICHNRSDVFYGPSKCSCLLHCQFLYRWLLPS